MVFFLVGVLNWGIQFLNHNSHQALAFPISLVVRISGKHVMTGLFVF